MEVLKRIVWAVSGGTGGTVLSVFIATHCQFSGREDGFIDMV